VSQAECSTVRLIAARTFERVPRLADHDLAQQRSPDTRPPFLVRSFERQQVEAGPTGGRSSNRHAAAYCWCVPASRHLAAAAAIALRSSCAQSSEEQPSDLNGT